jgi:hypothetical protein
LIAREQSFGASSAHIVTREGTYPNDGYRDGEFRSVVTASDDLRQH